MQVLSVIIFNGQTADETCFGCAPLLLICIPQGMFPQHSLHHIIYILWYDIYTVHHHSKQHSKITEGNIGLHMVRLTQEHNAATLIFQMALLSGI